MAQLTTVRTTFAQQALATLSATILLACSATALDAQSRIDAPSPGSDTSARAAAPKCAPMACDLALERGTVDGTRIRIGSTDETIAVGFTGSRAYRLLSAVPSAARVAARGRSAKRQSLAIAAATLGGVSVVALSSWRRPYEGSRRLEAPGVSLRLLTATLVSAGGMFFANRRARAADPHFEEAVRLYNQDRPR